MKPFLIILSLGCALPGLANAAPAKRFDLVCYEIGQGGHLKRDRVDQHFRVDGQGRKYCRVDINGGCEIKPFKKRGRWWDLSYRFTTPDGKAYEVSRIYDTETGYLDQVIRIVGQSGNPYGDLACEAAPFSGFRPSMPASPPGTAARP